MRPIAVALVAASSCSPQVELALPDGTGARSFVLALESETEPGLFRIEELRAFDLDTMQGDPWAIDEYDGAHMLRFTALFYSLSAEELGFVPGGSIPRAAENELESRSLPAFSSGWQSVVNKDRAAEWSAISALSGELAGFKTPDAPFRDRWCNTLAPERSINIPMQMNTAFLLPLDDDYLLLGTAAGLLHRVNISTSSVEPVTLSSDAPQSLLLAAFRGVDGVWFAGDGGRLYRGQLSNNNLTVTLVSTSAGEDTIEWLDGAGGDEIYARTREGRFLRYAGGRWTIIAEFDSSDPAAASRGGVAYLGPGQAIAVSSKKPSIARYRNGLVEVGRDPDPHWGVTSSARVADYGAVVGTNSGKVFRENERGEWDYLGGWNMDQIEMTAILALGTGFVAAGTNGQVARYTPPYGLCVYRDLGATESVHEVVRVGNVLVLAGQRTNDLGASDLPVSRLRIL